MYGIYELPIDYGTRYFQSTILPLLMAILVRYLYWLTIVMGPLHTGIQSNTVPIACHFSTGTHRYGRVGVGHILCSIPPLPTRDPGPGTGGPCTPTQQPAAALPKTP